MFHFMALSVVYYMKTGMLVTEKVSLIEFGRMRSWHNRDIIPQLAETEENADNRQ